MFEKESKTCVHVLVSKYTGRIFFSACGGQIMKQNLSWVISKNTKGPDPNDHFTFRKALQLFFFLC